MKEPFTSSEVSRDESKADKAPANFLAIALTAEQELHMPLRRGDNPSPDEGQSISGGQTACHYSGELQQ